jgi:DNA polymerase III psi subunit
MNKGIDIEKEITKILLEELTKSVNEQIINDVMASMKIIDEFNLKLKEIKALNRDIQIDNILYGTNNPLLEIENTDEYNKLSDELKQAYIKNGKLL